MNCSNCGAPLQADKARGVLACTHCGSVQPQPALIVNLEVTGTSASKCPGCAVPLATGRLDGHPLLVCQRCQGMLIAMTHFVSVIEAARAREEQRGVIQPREQNAGDRVLACPQCEQPMLNHVYGGPGNIVIDTCERCHVNWLDPGELRRIARA
jgi:Zn-finger nucleic acid-binding protein